MSMTTRLAPKYISVAEDENSCDMRSEGRKGDDRRHQRKEKQQYAYT